MAQSDLDRLVSIWLNQREAGQEQPPEAVCDAAGHPELVEQLKEEVRFLKKLDGEVTQAGVGNVSTFLAKLNEPDLTASFHEQVRAGLASGESQPVDFGEYEILGEIARGGMGVVYRARQKGLNRIVALKMILGGKLASEMDVKRFYTEAEAAARLDHPGIVPIYEVNRTNDQHYYTMGYVDGPSLASKIGGTPLPPREAAELLIEIADAVQFAHQQGVIHRDLKPQNILLTSSGKPRVTDFGLAKRLGNDSNLTSSGQILGTPNYMSPEQAAGRVDDIGPAADVYALGGILYCCLVGRPPFEGRTLTETLQQVQFRELTPPSQLNPKVHRDLSTICARALAKSPSARYDSAGAFAADLRRFCNGEPILARREGWVPYLARRVRRHLIAYASLAVVILVIAFATWFVWSSSDAYQLTALNQRLESELDARVITPEGLARLDELVAALAKVAPETEAVARKRITDRLASSIQQQIDRPRLSLSDFREIQGQIDLAGKRAPSLAAPLNEALQRRLRKWDTVIDLHPPFIDIASAFPTLNAGRSELSRSDESGAVVLADIASSGNATLEAEFSPLTGSNPRGLILCGRQGHSHLVTTLCFSPDGKRLLTGAGLRDSTRPGELKLWDVMSGAVISSHHMPVKGEPQAVFLSNDECLVTATWQPKFWMLRLKDGQWVEHSTPEQLGNIQQIVASSDLKQVAVPVYRHSDGSTNIYVWNSQSTTTPQWRLVGNSKPNVTLMRIHTNGKELAWYAGQDLNVVSLEDGKLQPPRTHPSMIDLASDLRTALFREDSHAQIRDLAKGRTLVDINTHLTHFSGSVFAPAGQLVLVPTSFNSTGYRLTDGQRLFELLGEEQRPGSEIRLCGFSPDGRLYATAIGDGSVTVWQVETQQQVTRLSDGGYYFLLQSRSPSSGGGTLELRRNQVVLRQQDVSLPSEPIRLLARREGDMLSCQVNDLPPVEFRDPFPLPADESGRFGLLLGANDRVLSVLGRRQGKASNPSPLDAADELYASGNYAAALKIYAREAHANSDGPILQESQYKQALCLLALGKTVEADELLSNLAGQTGERWPPNAACQLWLRRLRERDTTGAEQLLESLTLRYRFEELAGLIPEDLRSKILDEYRLKAVGANLFIHNPTRVQQVKRAAEAQKLLFKSGGEWPLLRAYHGSGQIAEALQFSEELIAPIRVSDRWDKSVGFAGSILQEHLWLLRLQGRAEEALKLLDDWPTSSGWTPERARAWQAADRVRLLDALGKSAEAETEADTARQILQAELLKEADENHRAAIQQLHRQLGLMLGILRDRRGDVAGALNLWQAEIKPDWDKADLSLGLIDDHILASLAGQMTTQQASSLMTRILGSMGDSGKVMQVSGIADTLGPPFAGMFQSPRGRQTAYEIVFRTVSLPNSLRRYPQLTAYEMFRRSLLTTDSNPQHDQLIWETCDRALAAYSDGRVKSEVIVPLVLTWKGTSGFLGWGAAAPALSPDLRGPLAFLFGLRYQRLNRPQEALNFFKQAETDTGPDSPFGQAAIQQQQKLK